MIIYRLDVFYTKKNTNYKRILLHNPNVTDIGTYSHALRELCIKTKEREVNILCLPETNTHWKNKESNDTF